MKNKFSLTKQYLGYINSTEQTKVDPRYLVSGSKNYLIDDGQMSITSRPGMERVGVVSTSSNGILGEWSGMVAKNNWRNLRTWDRYLQVLAYGTWYTLKSDISNSRVQFSRVFDTTEKNGILNFVLGDTNIYTWSGGVAKVASSTAGTVTLQGTYTAATIAFVDSNPDTITDSANGFVTAGFAAGDVVTVSGSTSNNRRFTIASVSAGTITLISDNNVTTEAAGASITIHSGYPTWKTRGFFSAGTRAILVNGVEYTYTGGEGTATLTGLSGFTASAGDVVLQVVRTTALASPVPSGYTADFCGTQRNQFWIGSETSQLVFASKTTSYTDFSYTASRVPGEGVELSLDGFCAGFEASEKDITIFDSSEGVFSVVYQLSSDNTVEAVSIEKKKTSYGQGLKSPNAKASIKNAIAYITTEPTLDTVGNIENIASEQSVPLSDPIKRDFDELDFTDCFVRYWKRNIVISVPMEGLVYLYDLKKGFWHPPQEFATPIGALGIDENGNLLGHAYGKDETYKLFTGTNDGETGVTDEYFAITYVAVFPYWGIDDSETLFSRYWVDGYLSSNAVIDHTIRYEMNGSGGTSSSTIDGLSNPHILFGNSSLHPLGRSPLGSRPLGGGGTSSDLTRFRTILSYPEHVAYEVQSEFRCEVLDSQVTLVNHGPEVFDSGNAGTDITLTN